MHLPPGAFFTASPGAVVENRHCAPSSVPLHFLLLPRTSATSGEPKGPAATGGCGIGPPVEFARGGVVDGAAASGALICPWPASTSSLIHGARDLAFSCAAEEKSLKACKMWHDCLLFLLAASNSSVGAHHIQVAFLARFHPAVPSPARLKAQGSPGLPAHILLACFLSPMLLACDIRSSILKIEARSSSTHGAMASALMRTCAGNARNDFRSHPSCCPDILPAERSLVEHHAHAAEPLFLAGSPLPLALNTHGSSPLPGHCILAGIAPPVANGLGV